MPILMRVLRQAARSTGSPSTTQMVGSRVVLQPVRRKESGDRFAGARHGAAKFDPRRWGDFA